MISMVLTVVGSKSDHKVKEEIPLLSLATTEAAFGLELGMKQKLHKASFASAHNSLSHTCIV